jgi:hypothetical protein
MRQDAVYVIGSVTFAEASARCLGRDISCQSHRDASPVTLTVELCTGTEHVHLDVDVIELGLCCYFSTWHKFELN